MRHRTWILGASVALVGLLLVGCSPEPIDATAGPDGAVLFLSPPSQAYQTSTITALLAGDYDGDLTCGELLEHGDFGLGTFDGLDGEMIVLDGVVYRARLNGDIEVVDDAEETPFAVVTFFEEWGFGFGPLAPADMDDLKKSLAGMMSDSQKPHAFHIRGTFETLLTRSVPKQSKPYPPLTEAIKGQQEREHTNIKGTIVGFYFPKWAAGANVAGYHFHFISDDKTVGGHVLAMYATSLDIRLVDCDSVFIELLEDASGAPTLTPEDQHKVLQDIESR